MRYLPQPRALASALIGSLLLLFSASVQAYSPKPDLTATGAIATLKADANSSPLYNVTYNLGPTGLRGWIYIDRNNVGDEGLMTAQSRQILVTHVGTNTPAVGVLAVDDVILGVAWGAGGGSVPTFTNDCRKSFGWAIGEAEQAANGGVLRLKLWRAGVTNDVQITLPVMGTYSDTAPWNCPKSALILSNAIPKLVAETLTSDWKGPVSALALLSTGNPNHVPTVRTLARSISDASAGLQAGRGLNSWDSGYKSILLAEYYLATGDAYVLPGISNYAVAIARSQSLYGTFGHGGALLKSDGSYNGSVPWYGPVNSAGLPVNIGMVLCKKAILASGGVVPPEIDPAIARAAGFFGYYANKGGIPYGEHQSDPSHGDNGKGGMTAVLFGLMGDQPAHTEYFARSSVSSFVGEEYGHTGQGFAYLWTALGANVGGSNAAAAFLKEKRWHRDLTRRANGSFIYDGGEQYSGSSVANYWSPSSYYGLSPTATYILQLTLPFRNLYLTGKNPSPGSELPPSAVSNAVWSGTFRLVCAGYSTSNLLAALGEYDSVVRDAAAVELGARTNEHNTLRPQLIVMAEDMTDANKREAACRALGYMGTTNALPALSRRLTDPHPWVRTRAATALGQLGSNALPVLNAMLTAFVTNAAAPNVIDWDDPIQFANAKLASILFNTQPFRTQIRNQPADLFYAAIRVGLRQPDAAARGALANFIKQDLNWNDVKTLAPDLVEVIAERAPADQMFAEGIRYAGLETFGKFKVEEGLPLSLMVKEQTWHSDDWNPFVVLRDMYGTAAAEVLPTLYDWQAHLPAFAADGSIPDDRYSNIVSYISTTIAALEAGTPPAPLNYFKSLNYPSATPLGVNRVQLATSATDLDGGVPRYIWSKVSGPGNVLFSTNGTTAGSNVVATFETPGVYVLRASVADSSILNGGVWNKPVLGYYDFKTYEHDYGAVATNRTIAVTPGTNWPPMAYAQSVATGIGTARALTLVGFDYDGDALSFATVNPPAHGNLSGTAPNVIYTPTIGYVGSDAFTFRVTDSRGMTSAVATVSIDVRNLLVMNVNFNGISSGVSNEVESTLYGPAGGLGTEWNQYTSMSSVGTVVDTNGAATAVTFTTTASDGWAWGNPTLKLLRSGVTHFGKGVDMNLTLAGLTPAGRYHLWLTSHANNGTLVERARGTWSTTNSTTSPSTQVIDGVTLLNGSTWQAGSNYVHFANVVADGTGRIVFLGDAADVGDFDTNAYRLPLNGFQIVQQPSLAPATPTNVSATPGNAAVTLAWDAVPGATGYLVKRSSTPGGSYTTRANPAGTYFMDSPAANGQTWYYVVSALDVYAESANSAEVSATPAALPLPAAPANLAATAGVGAVDLSWNPSATAYNYIVKRGVHPGGPYAALATIESTNYQDATVLNNMPWYYVVSAVNLTGEGTNSTEVAALPRSVTQVINVNLNGYTGGEAVRTETESLLVGPAGGLGTRWNQFTNASAVGTLIDSNGIATTVTFTTTASEGRTWGSPALTMLHSALTHFGKGTDNKLTLTNLAAGAAYKVWLASHANNTATAERAHGIWSTTNSTTSPSAQTINGVTTLNGTTWEAGNNFVVFGNVIADNTGRLVFNGDATDTNEFDANAYRLPLNGFQIWKLGTNPPPAYTVWAIDPAQGLTQGVNDGPGDDPEFDGLANLLEFVLGGNPLANSTALLPKLNRVSNNWFYEYDRSDVSAPPATTQVVEYSTNLVNWTQVNIPASSAGIVTITPGSPSDHVRVALPELGRAAFLRLKVTE